MVYYIAVENLNRTAHPQFNFSKGNFLVKKLPFSSYDLIWRRPVFITKARIASLNTLIFITEVIINRTQETWRYISNLNDLGASNTVR